jgi:hypothetical protein
VSLSYNLTKIGIYRQALEKIANMEVHEIPSSSSRSYTCGRTDGQTDRPDEDNTLFVFERVESVLTGISGIAIVRDQQLVSTMEKVNTMVMPVTLPVFRRA